MDLRLLITDRVYGSAPVKVRCPVHADPSASLAVYADNIHCYGCGYHRNDADEAAAAILGVRVEEAREQLKSVETIIPVTHSVPLPPPPMSSARMYHRFLTESPTRMHRMQWLTDRGLSRETIDKALLGHDGIRFVIPVFAPNGSLATLRFRIDDVYEQVGADENTRKAPKYSGLKGRNGFYVYGANWLKGDEEEVWLCEGEYDVLSAMQTGRAAVTGTNGASMAEQTVRAVRELLPSLKAVLVATDMDSAGEAAARSAAMAASRLGLSATRLKWFDSKDISEHLVLNGGKLNAVEGTWNGSYFTARIGGRVQPI